MEVNVFLNVMKEIISRNLLKKQVSKLVNVNQDTSTINLRIFVMKVHVLKVNQNVYIKMKYV
jgi:hypothetical protein